ncbi:hypothetical protein COO60DRAFT_874290 [Scenedesmus sp. NREL 46B-D3]|nr:hypothetical protein COO60DRAFT_874290 [Scenedesmus sp. NREL 46B-D3]
MNSWCCGLRCVVSAHVQLLLECAAGELQVGCALHSRNTGARELELCLWEAQVLADIAVSCVALARQLQRHWPRERGGVSLHCMLFCAWRPCAVSGCMKTDEGVFLT